MQLQPIDGQNLVAGLKASLGGWHAGFDLADAYGFLLHPRYETDGVKIEVV